MSGPSLDHERRNSDGLHGRGRLMAMLQRRLAMSLKRRRYAVLGVGIWFAAVFFAFQGDAAKPSAAIEGQQTGAAQDFVYFTPERPIFVRLWIYIDGKPFREVWTDHLKELFAVADGNDDESLTEAEVEQAQGSRTPYGDELTALLQSPVLWQADVAPPNGRLSFAEFEAFAEQVQSDPLQSSGTLATAGVVAGTIAANTSSDEAGEVLFDVLDQSKNGALSGEELRSAGDAIATLDFDSDGTLSLEEMQHDLSPYSQRSQAQSNATGPVPLFEINDRVITRLVDELLKMESGGRRSAAESVALDRFKIAAGSESRFDADRNGRMDRDELRYFLGHPVPEMELVLRIETHEDQQPAIEIVHKPDAPRLTVRIAESGLANIAINEFQLEIGISAQQPSARSLEETVVKRFKSFDRDGNGYLDKDEAAPGTPFSNSFSLFDRDGNGQVYQEEVLSVMKGRISAGLSRTRVAAVDRGQDFFEILDTNRDRRLSRSEIIAAETHLRFWDSDGDGELRNSDVPRLYQVTVSRGTPSVPGFAFPSDGARSGAMAASSSEIAPPKWFVKMDSNEDGAVSPREFLGTADQFQAIDLDRNELIDPVEAASK